MKKLLLASIVLLPFAADAQKFEIGIHGGLGLNSVPSGINHTFPSSVSTNLSSPAAKSSFVASVKGLVNIKRWQLGVGADMQKISSRTAFTEFIYANPAVPVYIIANRKIRGFYAGIMGGLLMPLKRIGETVDQGVPKQLEIQANTGYTIGAQAGYTYTLANNIGFNIEAGMRFAATSYNTATSSGDMCYFYYPVTVGFRFML